MDRNSLLGSNVARSTGLASAFYWLDNTSQGQAAKLYETFCVAMVQRRYLAELGLTAATVPYTPDGRLHLLGTILKSLDNDPDVRLHTSLQGLRALFRDLAHTKYKALQYRTPVRPIKKAEPARQDIVDLED